MESCREYFCCRRTNCVMYQREDGVNCWEMEGTLCNSPALQQIEEDTHKDKEAKCDYCIYYRQAQKELALKGKL
ncbi:hypothetical protein [Aestuariirhabdus litorea]|uniref:Uncharacterized protein n=1 Tax=Aestuariirhabdus litorea TaxID=2528527 RepID=A0A3P3VN29_9GAMM|nr:hypothetical protein [Aestuariirhabdus litorea]RRJ84105.1 hypothetical protein D0544_03000 [Aestuariirhabdus litorea]RWW97325.1 hypothetical protein DZC74_02995 [Endozoicomonadaceae bacterium GTF-13]